MDLHACFLPSSPFQIGKRSPGAKPSAPAQYEEGAVQQLDPAGIKRANGSVPTVRRCQESEGKEHPCVVPVKPDAEGYKRNKSLPSSLLPQAPRYARDGHQSCPFLGQPGRRTAHAPEGDLEHRAVGSFVGEGLRKAFGAGTFGKLLFSLHGGVVGGELLQQEALPKSPLVPCRPLLCLTAVARIHLPCCTAANTEVVGRRCEDHLMCSLPKSWQQPAVLTALRFHPQLPIISSPLYGFASAHGKLLVKDSREEVGEVEKEKKAWDLAGISLQC